MLCYSTTGVQEVNPIYSPKDFLEVLICIRNSNYNSTMKDVGGLMKLNLNIKSFSQLVC